MNAIVALTRAETRLFLRDPFTWGAAVILPTVILVVLGLVFGNRPDETFGGFGFVDYFTPSLVVLTVATLSVNTMTTRLATYREIERTFDSVFQFDSETAPPKPY